GRHPQWHVFRVGRYQELLGVHVERDQERGGSYLGSPEAVPRRAMEGLRSREQALLERYQDGHSDCLERNQGCCWSRVERDQERHNRCVERAESRLHSGTERVAFWLELGGECGPFGVRADPYSASAAYQHAPGPPRFSDELAPQPVRDRVDGYP